MKLGYSLWISNEDNIRIFGLGPYRLLLGIDELPSKASKRLERAEEEMNIKLLEKRIGGSGGGGSTLTEEAKDLLDKYKRYMESTDRELSRIFKEIFLE